MALSTYAELCAAVGRWLNRTDLADVVPAFVALAEARVAKVLRTADAEATVVLNTAAGVDYVDLPADFLEARGLSLVGTGGLIFLAAPAFWEAFPGGASGRPTHYAIIGRRLYFGPTPDAAYGVRATYYAKPAALSDAAPTNWVLDRHPELLLYAALIETAPYLGDDARIAVWGGLFDDALGRVQSADGRARWGGGPLAIQVV